MREEDNFFPTGFVVIIFSCHEHENLTDYASRDSFILIFSRHQSEPIRRENFGFCNIVFYIIKIVHDLRSYIIPLIRFLKHDYFTHRITSSLIPVIQGYWFYTVI